VAIEDGSWGNIHKNFPGLFLREKERGRVRCMFVSAIKSLKTILREILLFGLCAVLLAVVACTLWSLLLLEFLFVGLYHLIKKSLKLFPKDRIRSMIKYFSK
jgi:hypothetical protein